MYAIRSYYDGSMIELVAEGNPNVIVARTASKIPGLAGLRVGFGFAHPDMVERIAGLKSGRNNILGIEAAYAQYSLPKWRMALGHAHNYYLNIAAETGLLGLSAYLALWAAPIWRLAKTVRGTRPGYVVITSYSIHYTKLYERTAR